MMGRLSKKDTHRVLSLQQLAQASGVAPSTLRAWGRRYSVPHVTKLIEGQPHYAPSAISAARTMARLIEDGLTPQQAARAVTGETQDGPEPEEVMQGLVTRSISVLDLGQLLAAMMASRELTAFLDEWLMPFCRLIGQSWADGTFSVDQEHAVSNLVMRRLSVVYEAPSVDLDQPTIMTALPCHSFHQVGLFAFSALCRTQGLNVHYLGADLPAVDLVAAVQRHQPEALVLAVPTLNDIKEAKAALSAISPGQTKKFVGGAFQDECGLDATPLGHSMAQAADTLRQAVGLSLPAAD